MVRGVGEKRILGAEDVVGTHIMYLKVTVQLVVMVDLNGFEVIVGYDHIIDVIGEKIVSAKTSIIT